jgi:biofilm PGA synthesis N-glycosyltransferase PgaC
LSRFQFFDFSASMIMTNYGILKKLYFTGNGANISFRKVTFEMAAGFKRNNHVASGDDVFLMESVVRLYPNGIDFVKSKQGMVVTKSEDNWTSLINQRIRWASKSMLMDGVVLKFIQAFVFFYSLLIIVLFLLSIMVSPAIFLTPLMIALFLKLASDFIFLNKLSYKFGRINAMRSFIFCFWIYFLHIIGSGIVAIFPKPYTWKGRKVS